MSESGAQSSEIQGDPPGVHDGDVHSYQARYLVAFRFDVMKLSDVEQYLLADSFSTLKGRSARLWKPPERREDGSYTVEHLYRDELLHAVTKYLFSERLEHDCRYFQVDELLTTAWFDNLSFSWKERGKTQTMPVKLVDSAHIQLFLSPQGIGVLSIALELRPPEMRMELLVAANYRIAQFRRRHEPLDFRHAHPSDDVVRWERMSDEAKQSLRSVTTDDPLEVRLQAAGGTFSLVEMIDRLLEPFKQAGTVPVMLQDEMFAYGVLRLKAGVDFDRHSDRDHWCTWLARLAQVEEAFHPSCGPNSMHLAEAVLNRLHWAAASQLGVAHMIADEPPHHPGEEPPGFVEQKPGIVRDKYFVPYLVALLQKLTIHAALHDARQIAEAAPEELGAKLAVFRRELLQFGVRGYFAQVSTREALHRFYQLAQRGLDVPTNWQVLQRSLQELESSVNAQQQLEGQSAQLRQQQLLVDQESLQREFTQSMDENLHEIRTVQTFLHFLEYPLISVYCAHLWHMFAETRWPNHHEFVSNGVVIAALLGFVIVLVSDWFDGPMRLHDAFRAAKSRRTGDDEHESKR